MKPIATLLACLVLAGTRRCRRRVRNQGRPGASGLHRHPAAIPAQKVDIRVSSPAPATAVPDTAPPAKQSVQQIPAPGTPAPSQATAQQTAQSTAEDRAQRCVQARQRYQTLMDNWRVYEPGPNGERTYLTSEQIDAARVNAKTAMDQFCAGQ